MKTVEYHGRLSLYVVLCLAEGSISSGDEVQVVKKDEVVATGHVIATRTIPRNQRRAICDPKTCTHAHRFAEVSIG